MAINFIAVNLELLRRSELDLIPAYAERYTDSGGTIAAALRDRERCPTMATHVDIL